MLWLLRPEVSLSLLTSFHHRQNDVLAFTESNGQKQEAPQTRTVLIQGCPHCETQLYGQWSLDFCLCLLMQVPSLRILPHPSRFMKNTSDSWPASPSRTSSPCSHHGRQDLTMTALLQMKSFGAAVDFLYPYRTEEIMIMRYEKRKGVYLPPPLCGNKLHNLTSVQVLNIRNIHISLLYFFQPSRKTDRVCSLPQAPSSIG